MAATEHFHKRISSMSNRIRQLEDALAILQASHSHEQHPLLEDDLLFIDNENLEPPTTAEGSELEDPTEAVINAFGTMSIMDRGVSRFFGPTGGPEGLLIVSPGLPLFFVLVLILTDPAFTPMRSTQRITLILQIQIQAAAPNPHLSTPKSPASRSPSPSYPWAQHTKSTR